MRSALRACLALALLLLAPLPALAVERELNEFLAWPLETALSGYQRFVSPYKPSSCSMYPSDSAYARQALARYGPLRGGLMTVDRLHRCGHDAALYRVILTADGPKLWDPLEDGGDVRP